MRAALTVGEHYLLPVGSRSIPVEVEAADEHEVVYRALNDQDAIDLGWGPTSYGTYEASTTPAEFGRDAVMSAIAPDDDGTEAESLAEVQDPLDPVGALACEPHAPRGAA